MNRIDQIRRRAAAGERSELADICVALASIICVAAWALLMSGMNSELGGVTDVSYATAYVVAGALGSLGIVASAVAGFHSRGATRTAAAVTFWLLLCPALWGGQFIVALAA